MDDPAAPERDNDRAHNSKRRPEASQRLDAAPNAGASVAKPQGSEQAQSAGRDRGRPKLDDDARPVALAFGGVEAQSQQCLDTSRTAEVPGREENGADAFPLGGRSLDGRRTSTEFGAALPDTSMETEDSARPDAAAAAATLVAPAQAPAAPPPPTTTLVAAAGGGAMAARTLSASATTAEAVVDAFLASPTDATAAALLATLRMPSADDADGQTMYATAMRLVSTTVAGTLRLSAGPENLKDILQDAGLSDASHGLSRANQDLVIRFMDPAEYKTKKNKQKKGKGSDPQLTFNPWLRASLIRLVEMLASRKADVVNETSAAEANAKWDEDVAAATASRADLMARGEDGDADLVLTSLLKSTTDLQASSGRLCHSAMDALEVEAYEYFPHGGWTTCGTYSERLAGFQQKLIEYAARAPAADELETMLDALSTKQVASMDASEATRRSVHAAQLAAVANTEVVGERPTKLEPEWDVAGRLRARGERAVEESAPESLMGCHLGPLHPCHNGAIAASIRESGRPLPGRTLGEGQLAENQMFFDARDVPKPKTPEEMVRNFRARSTWDGSKWIDGGAGEASRARAAAQSTGVPAAESDEDFDPGL